MSMEQALLRALVESGVGAIMAVLVLVGVYRVVRGLGSSFIESQHRAAEALGAQAQAVMGLTTSVQDFIRADNTEHREMIVLLRFIAQQQKQFDEVRFEHNKRKEQTHPHCPAGTP
jgi:hypothetical protein